MKASIAYRSPAGRVVAFDKYGAKTECHEPGVEAEKAWQRLGLLGATMCPMAVWLDKEPSAPEGWNDTMTRTAQSESAKAMDAETNVKAKPKVKRQRSGTWTKISKQIPIPGTESDTADLDMYRVEYAGEEMDVDR